MAHLLGSKYCIESLRSDVTDLQSAVVDVFSRTGPVNFRSWKYPDKVSADLDITELLEEYDYSEDEEERQVSHIVLLELTIDRLLLLLQAMSKFTDQLWSAGQRAQSAHTSTSVGVTVKKYWNNMVQLSTIVQQLQSENRSKTRNITDLENNIKKLQKQLDEIYSEENKSDSSRPKYMADEVRKPRFSNYRISQDQNHKSSQTVETAFVPCDACHVVQTNMKRVGDMVINICQSQELPSSLAKHRSEMEIKEWLTANDVARWAAEENKDLSRVNKHLTYLISLKSDLESERKRNQQMKTKVADCEKEVKLERETQAVIRKQYESKIKDINQKNSESLDTVKTQNDGLRNAKTSLEKKLSEAKTELKNKEEKVAKLVKLQQTLEEDLEENRVKSAEIQQLELQLEKVGEDLSAAEKEINKERAKNKCVSRHSEAMKEKQDSIFQRLDGLDRENDELRNQVSELEEKRESLEDSLDRMREEKGRIEYELKEEQKRVRCIADEKDGLEQSIQELREDIGQLEAKLQEASEQQKLLVEFPDLNGPVNPNIGGTGDIAQDMELQVQANNLRIQLLEDENSKLQHSISKMLEAQSRLRGEAEMPAKPVQLWNLHDSRVERTSGDESRQKRDYVSERTPPGSRAGDDYDDDVSIELMALDDRKSTKDTSCNPRRAPNQRDVKLAARKQDTKTKAPSVGGCGGGSLAAYQQLKKSGLIKPPSSKGRKRESGSSKAPSSGSSDYTPSAIYTCSSCGKMYSDVSDLDIHKSYCYGVR